MTHCGECPKVMGLDLALTVTGGASVYGWHWSFDTKKLRDVQRLDAIRRHLRWQLGVDTVRPALSDTLRPDIVAIEGFAYGAKGNAVFEIGGLGWIVRMLLWDHGIPYVIFSPSQIKKYATGKGNANKNAVMIAAHKRLGYDGSDDNEADALWARALCLASLGHPMVDLPQANREAVKEKITIYGSTP